MTIDKNIVKKLRDILDDQKEQEVQRLKGPKGDPGPVGPIGPKGDKGDKGDKPILNVDYFLERGPRGLLCRHCNACLGWYERYRNYIENYLNKYCKNDG